MKDGALLMALVVAPNASEEASDSEPIVVLTDQWNAQLVLDDGTTLHFDRSELQAALQNPARTREAA